MIKIYLMLLNSLKSVKPSTFTMLLFTFFSLVFFNRVEAATITGRNCQKDNTDIINCSRIEGTLPFRSVYFPFDTLNQVNPDVGEHLLIFELKNTSDKDYKDVHFNLGFGEGSEFRQVNINALLDFDTPEKNPKPTSQVFSDLQHEFNHIGWSNGTWKKETTRQFRLSVDVPDFNEQIPGFAKNDQGNGYRFTIRVTPSTDGSGDNPIDPKTTPEPTSIFSFLAFSFLGILRAFKRT